VGGKKQDEAKEQAVQRALGEGTDTRSQRAQADLAGRVAAAGVREELSKAKSRGWRNSWYHKGAMNWLDNVVKVLSDAGTKGKTASDVLKAICAGGQMLSEGKTPLKSVQKTLNTHKDKFVQQDGRWTLVTAAGTTVAGEKAGTSVNIKAGKVATRKAPIESEEDKEEEEVPSSKRRWPSRR